MKLTNSDGRPWYRERWPWILMTGPAVVVVAGIATAVIALRTSDGLVADDYYKQGLAVNQQLQRDHQAQSLGLKAELMRSGQQLRVVLTSLGKEEMPKQLTLKVVHPTRAGEDQNVAMQAEGAGVYGGKLTRELAGRWYVMLDDSSGKWRLQGDWKVDDGAPLQLVSGDAQPVNAISRSGK